MHTFLFIVYFMYFCRSNLKIKLFNLFFCFYRIVVFISMKSTNQVIYNI